MFNERYLRILLESQSGEWLTASWVVLVPLNILGCERYLLFLYECAQSLTYPLTECFAFLCCQEGFWHRAHFQVVCFVLNPCSSMLPMYEYFVYRTHLVMVVCMQYAVIMPSITIRVAPREEWMGKILNFGNMYFATGCAVCKGTASINRGTENAGTSYAGDALYAVVIRFPSMHVENRCEDWYFTWGCRQIMPTWIFSLSQGLVW